MSKVNQIFSNKHIIQEKAFDQPLLITGKENFRFRRRECSKKQQREIISSRYLFLFADFNG